MKTPVKVSMKLQRIAGALSRVLSQNVNHLQVYLCGIRSSLIFFWQGSVEYIKQKISCFRVFLEKDHPSLVLGPGKKHHIFEKKIPPFQRVQERSSLNAMLFETTIFSDYLRKISYFRVFFFRKIIFQFPSGCKIILSGKRNVTFPDNTRKRIFQGDFFGKNIFSGRLEKKYGFPCSGV